jgi:hypothetical protein
MLFPILNWGNQIPALFLHLFLSYAHKWLTKSSITVDGDSGAGDWLLLEL